MVKHFIQGTEISDEDIKMLKWLQKECVTSLDELKQVFEDAEEWNDNVDEEMGYDEIDGQKLWN
jgi:hypothetical protein|tara:strand:- start:3436 stop:3627 length:192 start_codon:yes stop_codon:yes gene_type:complete